jgi:L-alanine-DL-glutamate epimerase-like enolase superfamily enzyme
MNCEVIPLDLRLVRDFIVAGGRTGRKRNYVVVLDEVGLGEAAGSVQYGATPEVIETDLAFAAKRIRALDETAIPSFLETLEGTICAPALCALSTAWHDNQGKRLRQRLHERLGLSPAIGLKTSVTVSIGDLEALAEWRRAGYDLFKIKMDADAVRAGQVLELICETTDVQFRIDANASWDYDDAVRVAGQLPPGRVELIEQPFSADALDDWMKLREKTDIPLIMDESIANRDDVKRAARYVDGVNVKIQKSGRLETAVAAMRFAEELKLKVMLGCMIESSVGIAAARELSALADYLDLDGRLLCADDPFSGLSYERGYIQGAEGWGHGVVFA